MATVSDSSVRPTTIMNSNSRFGTTFLSKKYRDRAVPGEAIMDKTSGELFIKRVSDGKVVSFSQNKKTLNDLALDLHLSLLYNKDFVYPSKNVNAFYISSNYDLIAINNESLYNLMTDNVSISGAPNDINKLTFTVSGGSNGFFCRNATRDIDKPFIEFLTNQYNTILKNYTGTDTLYLNEYEKFQTNENWENSNAVLTYDIIATKGSIDYVYADNKAYIMLNDDSPVLFPNQIVNDLGTFEYATVTIKSIEYDKLHFMINNKAKFGSIFTDAYNKIIPNDGTIEVAEFNISYFIDNANDIKLLGNEDIIGFLDIPHLNMYIKKMTGLIGSSESTIEISRNQPSKACIWFKPNS